MRFSSGGSGRFHSVSSAGGICIVLVGCAVLVSWIIGLRVTPGPVLTKASSSIGLILAGIGLALLSRRTPTGVRRAGVYSSLGALLIGLEAIAAHFLEVGSGFDRLFLAEPEFLQMRGEFPTTGSCLALSAASIISTHVQISGKRLSQPLALLIIVISGLSLVGYIFGVGRIGPFSSMSMLETFAFLVLGISILHARPDLGWMDTITKNTPAGAMLRRVLPVAVILPLVLGWLSLLGLRADMYGPAFGIAVFAVSNILVLSVLLWQNAISINRADYSRMITESRYRVLFDSNPLPMWVYDLNSLAFLAVNDAAVREYGYSREEFSSMTIKDIRPEEDVPSLLRSIDGPSTRLKKSGIWRHRRKDGTVKDVEIVSNRIVFGGRVARLVLSNDITEKNRALEWLKRTEERYRTTLDHMMEGAQIIGPDFRYLYLNDVAAQQGRRPKEELLGRLMSEAYPGIEHTEMFDNLRKCLAEQAPVQMQNEFDFPDGSKGWFDLNIQPVPEGIFILSVDITEKKRQEEELRTHREHLEELVAKRTAQLDVVNKELEAFSYSVSHDLRAPLRHIHGFVNLLEKGTSGKLDEQNREYLAVIRQSAERMGKLIDDLLSFSRTGRAEVVRVRLDMKHVFDEAIAEMSRELQGRKVEWLIDEMPEVAADPALLKLVVVNLVSNALKYTRTREVARIHASWLPGTNGEVIFFIQDNGVGFEMKYQDKLFGVFQRLHRAEEFEGTGIGLANVRRIVQRHGGRTWAEGHVGSGATFYFSLPS